MNYYDVVVYIPSHETFLYSHPEPILSGVRVCVPFGRRKLMGVVWRHHEKFDDIWGVGKDKVKDIIEVIDKKPTFSPVLRQIAEWMSSYYYYSLSDVLTTMLPPSLEKPTTMAYELTEFGLNELGVHQEMGATLVEAFGKKSKLSEAVLRKKKFPIARALKLGLIAKVEGEIKVRPSLSDFDIQLRATGLESDQIRTLTAKQKEAFEAICQLDHVKPVLLKGVTGSGKTEIYLQIIARAFKQHGEEAQVLVLVPEISLTPQTTRVFSQRFPGQVSVVHSAMTNLKRWEQLEKIRNGQSRILIGPRSAVFGPFLKLVLIVVDEEHDASYKQTTGLCYNGRDMAVLRAKFETAMVILGSATPSLESYHNALQGKYELIELGERVGGRSMPEIVGVEHMSAKSVGHKLGPGFEPNHAIPIHPTVLEAIEANLAKGQQTIILVNRRGYSYFLLDLATRTTLDCPRCSISLTSHARLTVLRCHYCDYSVSTNSILAKTDATFVSVGYGSEQAELFFQQQFPTARIRRVDSDTSMRREALSETLAEFGRGEVDILVGTQMLAKGHDFPKVTLTIILEVDQLLNLPDFRAGERTFQLMVQASGRSGRGTDPGKVLVQSSKLNHRIVQAGLRQDYSEFVQQELRFRKVFDYPPFAKLVAFEITSEDESELKNSCRKMEAWLARHEKSEQFKSVRVLGPATPSIDILRKRHRRSLIFMSRDPRPLRDLTQTFLRDHQRLPRSIRLKVDVDPQSLL